MDRLTAAWPLMRDIAIVLTALVLIIFEAVFRDGPERTGLLLLYTGMLGLPLVVRADQKRSNGRQEPSSPAEAER